MCGLEKNFNLVEVVGYEVGVSVELYEADKVGLCSIRITRNIRNQESS